MPFPPISIPLTSDFSEAFDFSLFARLSFPIAEYPDRSGRCLHFPGSSQAGQGITNRESVLLRDSVGGYYERSVPFPYWF
jgi:hypothetical protein